MMFLAQASLELSMEVSAVETVAYVIEKNVIIWIAAILAITFLLHFVVLWQINFQRFAFLLGLGQ